MVYVKLTELTCSSKIDVFCFQILHLNISITVSKAKKKAAEKKEEQKPKEEAFNRLVTDMHAEEDLDLSLHQEEQLLQMFLNLLQV